MNSSIKRRTILYAVQLLTKSTENISLSQIENILKINATGKTYFFGDDLLMRMTPKNILIAKGDIDIPQYEYKIQPNQICYIKETGISYLIEEASVLKKQKNTVYFDGDFIDPGTLSLRTRRDGDLFSPSGVNGYKKIKKFFIDEKIPFHQRNLYPLLVSGNKILAILPLRVDNNFTVKENTNKIYKITIVGGTYD